MPTREEEIAQHQNSIRVLSARLKELGAGSDASVIDLASKHQREDEAATLFERSTPAERAQLYQDDPEAWQRMMDDYEAKGVRRLFGGG